MEYSEEEQAERDRLIADINAMMNYMKGTEHEG